MGTEQVSRYVVGLLSTALAGQAVVDPASVLPLSSGASRQTWSFAAEKPDGMRCQYVLQSHLAVALPGFDPAEAGLDMGGQATLMRKAAEAGVPAPAVVAVGEHAGVPYLVTEWLPGEALPHRLLRDPELAPGVGRLMQDAASALARLHQLDPAAAPLPEQDQLARYRRRLDEIGEPRPVLELAYRWLELH
ncbi:MAG: phosphotransferase, partial [Acidimicrobiales bacterium]